MSQLINFIPKTQKECQALLKDLNENRDGIAIADRYGNIDALNAEEVKTLIDLIENQIGEKAPKAPKAEATAPKSAPTKKNVKK